MCVIIMIKLNKPEKNKEQDDETWGQRQSICMASDYKNNNIPSETLAFPKAPLYLSHSYQLQKGFVLNHCHDQCIRG